MRRMRKAALGCRHLLSPMRVAPARGDREGSPMRSRIGPLLMALVITLASMGAVEPVRAADEPGEPPIPIFAYYYIWFDAASWDRAKVDYPALGRYSSDDRDVMRQHVRWAKEAGIDGFIVSWKS